MCNEFVYKIINSVRMRESMQPGAHVSDEGDLFSALQVVSGAVKDIAISDEVQVPKNYCG